MKNTTNASHIGREEAYLFSAPANSSGFYAEIYSVLIGQIAPTDLAGELSWHRRGYVIKWLARSFIVPQRSLLNEVARLNAMRHEEAGWDGYNAQSPNKQTINAAIKFLTLLSKTEVPLPAATVSPSGNAALFDSNENYYLDIEFEPNNRVGWLLQLRGGPEIEDTEAFDGSALPFRLIALLRSAFP